jgi:predicted permease
MSTLLNDVRFALRIMRKNAGLTIVAVLTLSLGIGATVAIFSILYAVLLRPLPYRDTESLLTIWQTHPTIAEVPIGALDYGDMKQQNNVFSDVAGYTFSGYRAFTVIGAGEPEQLPGALVTINLFPLLGVDPLLGRGFSPEEEADPGSQVVMLSERIWRQRFSADPAAIGRAVDLDGQSFTVIGVLKGSNQFPVSTDLWFPVSQLTEEERTSRVVHALVAVARLKPGVSQQQAQTELDGIAERLEHAYPATNKMIRFTTTPFNDQFVGSVRVALWVLLGAVGLVLLIACANVANLMLAGGSARVTEIAVRSALGASRRRLVRQLLTESMMLSITGATLGVLLAYLGLPLLKSSLLSSVVHEVPRIAAAYVNRLVLAFAAGAGVFSGILFGSLPAFQISKTKVEQALKQEATASVGGARAKLRGALVAAEVALAVVVLIGAGLLIRSFRKVLEIDPGMRTDHVLTAHVLLPGTKYTQYQQIFDFYQQTLAKIKALPGVKWASTVSKTPLSPSLGWTRFALAGEPAPEPGQFPVARSSAVSPDYFRNVGIPLERGREFNDADFHDFETPPLIINATLAQRFFNGTDPVGRQILLGVMTPNPTAYKVCGVAADSHDVGIDVPPDSQIFFPAFGASETLLVGTSIEPSSLARSVANAVFEVDKNQPIDNIQTLDSILSASLARRRFSSVLLGAFSLLALLLASVGLYGVVSYTAAQRTREIGLRMALGASGGRVVRMLLLQGMRPVWFGLLLGIAGALGLTRLVATLLYGVTATDPLTFGSTLSVLTLVAALASYVPARRAARVDPAVALRHE